MKSMIFQSYPQGALILLKHCVIDIAAIASLHAGEGRRTLGQHATGARVLDRDVVQMTTGLALAIRSKAISVAIRAGMSLR